MLETIRVIVDEHVDNVSNNWVGIAYFKTKKAVRGFSGNRVMVVVRLRHLPDELRMMS